MTFVEFETERPADYLTRLATSDIGKGAASRPHFRQFMTNLTAYGLDRRGPVDSQSLERVLTWLREPVGQQVGLLAAQYGLVVSDELSRIVPNQNDWFFAQF